MSGSPYDAYDLLPVGIAVVADGRVVYANPTLAELLELPVSSVIGADPSALVRRAVPDPESGPLLGMFAAITRGEPEPIDVWARVERPRSGARSVRVRRAPGRQPADTLLVFHSGENESDTGRLLDALVRAASRFVRCREEQPVLEMAADALHQQGYWVAVLALEGDCFFHAAVRHQQEGLARGIEQYQQPIEQVPFQRAKVPHVEQMFRTHRAYFHADMRDISDAIHHPELAAFMRRTMPAFPGMDAPIYVEGEPWGFLSVHGRTITPSHAATVELFAQLIGGALENVRHHRRADEQMLAQQALQEELVKRERLAAIGEAAGVLSHEARNPLGAILNALAVLKRQDRLDADGREVLDIAEEEAFRLDALVRDLLELARPLEPRLREVSIPLLVEAILSDLRRRHGRRAPNVTLDVKPDLAAQADATLLRLAIENLLRNATQAEPGAAVRLSAWAEDGSAVIAVEGANGDGREVSEDFDPFSIVRARGTGLGLAVVKRVVEAQEGTVRIRQGGAWLELRLPLAS